jgi:prepilin-type processing-associated H-X9-DG protein
VTQLSKAILSYDASNRGFPPMALSGSGGHYNATQPGPGSWYDGHGWHSLTAPFIGYDAWASQINFNVSMSSGQNEAARRGELEIKIHECPSDIGLNRNEWHHANWARIHANYVVNGGNTDYGGHNNPMEETPPVIFLGAPFAIQEKTTTNKISDGTTFTLMVSEIKILGETYNYWGGAHADTITALGGQQFNGHYVPNSRVPDNYARGNGVAADFREVGLPVPTTRQIPAGSNSTLYARVNARSRHTGGVNASRCDGSTAFYSDNTSERVWRALSSAKGTGASPPEPQVPANQ